MTHSAHLSHMRAHMRHACSVCTLQHAMACRDMETSQSLRLAWHTLEGKSRKTHTPAGTEYFNSPTSSHPHPFSLLRTLPTHSHPFTPTLPALPISLCSPLSLSPPTPQTQWPCRVFQAVLMKLAAGMTVVAATPAMVQQIINPSPRGLLLAMANSALAFYMFSYQVRDWSSA